MKLNLGCGHNKMADFLNVDATPACAPDLVFDCEQPNWPWETNSVTKVMFNHSLEHMGGEAKVFLRIMQELYRVCAPDAKVFINVPHPRHDNFANDPTHVRPITTGLLSMFDRQLNEQWQSQGAANTPLAIYLGVDFVIKRSEVIADPRYREMMKFGKLSPMEFQTLISERYNVVEEIRIVLGVRK